MKIKPFDPAASASGNDEGGGGDLLSSIPEVYFDVIARIIPGALAVWIFGHDLFAERRTALFSFFVLLAAYLLGLVLSIFADLIWMKPLIWLRKISGLHLHGDHDLWTWIRSELPPQDRRVYTKMMAEMSMFRTSSLVALLAVPSLKIVPGLWPPLPVAVGAFLVFAICMIVIYRWMGIALDAAHSPDQAQNMR